MSWKTDLLDLFGVNKKSLIERWTERALHAVQEAAALGQVEALFCPRGIHDASEDCTFASDPRGHGLAAVVQ